MPQTLFSLKLLAMRLESSWRNLASNKNIKIKKECRQSGRQNGSLLQEYSLKPTNSRDLHAQCWFNWFWSYRHHPCNIPVMQLMHHSEFDTFKISSRLVANLWEPHLTCRHVWWICNIPDVLPDGNTLYKHVYLNKWTQHAFMIELHCTSRHVWEWHLISVHVWCNDTPVRVVQDL